MLARGRLVTHHVDAAFAVAEADFDDGDVQRAGADRRRPFHWRGFAKGNFAERAYAEHVALRSVEFLLGAANGEQISLSSSPAQAGHDEL
jgi:hypothetical protein